MSVHFWSKPWKWLLGVSLLLGMLAGCDLLPNVGPQPQAPPPAPPTTAPFTPTFIVLPPTYTPTTVPTAAPTQPPTPTLAPTQPPTLPPSPTVAGQPSPTLAPTATNTAGGSNGPVFAGLCSASSSQPCLYSVGIMKYHGERVCRYVFENIPFPQTAFVEINGANMECIHLPEYPHRIYCMGVAPPTTPIQLRLGWYENGQRVDVQVDQAVVDAIQQQHLFPIGAPPTPTPRATPTSRYP